MEKKETTFKILIIILIFMVLGLSGYIVYDKFISKDLSDNKKETTKKEEEKSEENDDNFMFEDSYDYLLNGKNHKITYKYYYNECSQENLYYYCDESSYVITFAAYIDETKIENVPEIIYYGSNNPNDFSKIREELNSTPINEKNLMTLGSGDEEYLVLAIQEGGEYQISQPDLIIIDENGKQIKNILGTYNNIVLKNNIAENYKFDSQLFYVDDDKLYYLGTRDDENSCTTPHISIITIKDGEVVEETIKLSENDIEVIEGEC